MTSAAAASMASSYLVPESAADAVTSQSPSVTELATAPVSGLALWIPTMSSARPRAMPQFSWMSAITPSW